MRTLSRLLALVVAGLLGACATTQPFQATWYLLEDGDAAELYVVLLNQSSGDESITRLAINEGERPGSGWVLPVGDLPAALRPGQVLVRPAHRFAGSGWDKGQEGACQLPVVIKLVSNHRELLLRPAGQFPSALPAGWRACPGRPATVSR